MVIAIGFAGRHYMIEQAVKKIAWRVDVGQLFAANL